MKNLSCIPSLEFSQFRAWDRNVLGLFAILMEEKFDMTQKAESVTSIQQFTCQTQLMNVPDRSSIHDIIIRKLAQTTTSVH